MARILVTGAAGFIGGNFINYWFKKYPQDTLIGIDALTYAAELSSIPYFQLHPENFHQVNLNDIVPLERALDRCLFDHVVHFAAESHVCKSIEGPEKFLDTNVGGTFNLLNSLVARGFKGRFINIATDEIFGALGPTGKFNELTNLAPTSPYSASKACQKLWGDAFFHTYGLDIVTLAPTNNFGPRQHIEKLIPRVTRQILDFEDVTVYQQGTQVRDWLYVFDHCEAIEAALEKGKSGELYCIGGNKELTNLEMINEIHTGIQTITRLQYPLNLVHMNARPTDDFRYAVDTTKALNDLGWKPSENFKENLIATLKSLIIREIGNASKKDENT